MSGSPRSGQSALEDPFSVLPPDSVNVRQD